MDFFTACLITVCVGGSFSAAVWRWPQLMKSRLFRALGFALIPAGWCLMASGSLGSSVSPDPQSLALALLLGGVCSLSWIVFILHAMRHGVGRAAAWAMSDDRLVLRPAYSKAEAAETRREFADAEAAYRELILEHPADPEPRRRLAELSVKQGNVDVAVEAMTAAVALTRDVGDKFLLAIRLSELQADLAHDPGGAIATLEILVKANPVHRAAEFARKRIALLRSRGARST